MSEKYERILENFCRKNIAVIGDLMLDKYIFGSVERISQEAPIPVVAVDKERYVLGGAANTASNVKTLSGNTFLFGILGEDIEKEIFLRCAKEQGINIKGILYSEKMPTTLKIRVICQKQQMMRIDYESREIVDEKTSGSLLKKIINLKNLDAIVVSDYAKGLITLGFITKLISFCKKNKIPLIVDPKPKHKNFYYGVNLVKSNLKECHEMTHLPVDTKEEIIVTGKKLIEIFNADLILTMGGNGMAVFERKKTPILIPTKAKEVFDVSGAGDTVMAALALSILAGASLTNAAIIANRCAGIKVSKSGTAPVSIEELRENLKNEPPNTKVRGIV